MTARWAHLPYDLPEQMPNRIINEVYGISRGRVRHFQQTACYHRMRIEVSIYCRVSDSEQTCENQLLEIRQIASRNGWTIVNEFIDHGISGAKGRSDRPQFDALIKGVIRKNYEVILTWAVDRLGRSLQDLVSFLNEIHLIKEYWGRSIRTLIAV